MTDEKETPEAGQTEAEPEGTDEVAEAVEEVAEAETPAAERYSRRQLQQMTVKKLRDLALELGEVAGVHGMKKDELVEAIFALRGLEEAEAVAVLDVDKSAIKQEIRDLKERRASALEAGDATELKRVRQRIKRLKRALRKAS
ncbi:MAG: Rho termination factor N-terminal domain-containing protein [Candidatus Tectimicrobiota bacterium]